MLLPPLKTQQEYVQLAELAGLKVLAPPKDISNDVAKTWYVFIHILHLLLSPFLSLPLSLDHLNVNLNRSNNSHPDNSHH